RQQASIASSETDSGDSHWKRLVVYVLASVGLSYFLLATFLSGALSVLLATVVGCSVGVVLDDK
ncbi:hypothetical protein H7F43_05315, partial [Streptococcus sp. SPC0]|nr:hypothetical protein [Streptococcus sp. SPC0]